MSNPLHLPGGISQDATLIPHPDRAVNTGNTAGKGRMAHSGGQLTPPKAFMRKGFRAFQRWSETYRPGVQAL